MNKTFKEELNMKIKVQKTNILTRGRVNNTRVKTYYIDDNREIENKWYEYKYLGS